MQHVVAVPVLILTLCISGEEPKSESELSRFSVPGKKYALQIDLKGFKVEQDRLNDKGTGRYVLASNEEAGMTISFWMEPARKEGATDVCKKTMWSKEKRGKTAIKESKIGELDVIEYEEKEIKESGLEQKNYRLYLAHEKTWFDFHVSKMMPTEEDQEQIKKILGSIKIVEDPFPDSFTEFKFGSQFYRAEDYKRAAKFYERALRSEKHKRILKKDFWRVLVDNLGICYGVTGDYEKSIQVLSYGIQEEPEYPNFHYNLACTYAEQNELDKAITELKKAYQYKANVIKGERISDPRKDSSFKKYLDNAEFKKALKEIGLE